MGGSMPQNSILKYDSSEQTAYIPVVGQEDEFKHDRRGTFRVMSVNLANYDDHPRWDYRRERIADNITCSRADVIALQEIREDTIIKKNALCDLLEHLRSDYLLYWNKAMEYENFLNVTTCIEGQGIISRLTVKRVETVQLGSSPGDRNERIAVIAAVDVGDEEPLEFVSVHLTYDQNNSMGQLRDLRERLDQTFEGSVGQIVVGDFNIHGEWLYRDFMAGDNGFRDTAKVLDKVQPTHPSWEPKDRLDRVFYRGRIEPVEITVQEPCSSKEDMHSDHLYVVSEFKIKE
eukprot:TRINITY_DN1193_c0_g2_i4.p1 TRINITY_DN1193_c0_g2~~TRINITY_DN1193_c0_g2_i4.p1  ORF type:complete len:289 (-),score=44.78 TRINITY_DN1193_c0_g2_i4:109-975(-)